MIAEMHISSTLFLNSVVRMFSQHTESSGKTSSIIMSPNEISAAQEFLDTDACDHRRLAIYEVRSANPDYSVMECYVAYLLVQLDRAKRRATGRNISRDATSVGAWQENPKGYATYEEWKMAICNVYRLRAWINYKAYQATLHKPDYHE